MSPKGKMAVSPNFAFLQECITDAVRTAAVSWPITQLGGMTDGRTITNLCPNGGFELSTTGWAASGVGSTIATDNSQAKFGLQSCKVVTPADLGYGMVSANITITGGATYAISGWVLAPVGVVIALDVNSYDSGTFLEQATDAQTGTGEWQYFSTTLAVGATANEVRIFFLVNQATAATYWVDGVQLELGSVAHNYIDTNGSAVTKGEDLSIGIWPAATNLHPNGQNDSTSTFSDLGSGTITITVDTSVPAPYSPQSIKVVTDGTSAGQGTQPGSNAGLAAAAGTYGATAICFQGVPGESYLVGSVMENTDSTYTQATATTFTAGAGAWPVVTNSSGEIWEVLTPAPVEVAAGKTGNQLLIWVHINGTRAETFHVAHPMLQVGTQIVNPYIATSGGNTASVIAGRIRVPANYLNTVQGWLAAWITMEATAAQIGTTPEGIASIATWFGNGSNDPCVICWGGTGGWEAVQRGNSGAAVAVNTGSLTLGKQFVAMEWNSTEIEISVNGSTPASIAINEEWTTAAGAPLTLFDVGNNSGVQSWLYGQVNGLIAGTGTLQSSDLTAMNSWSLPPTVADAKSLSSNAKPTVLLQCENAVLIPLGDVI